MSIKIDLHFNTDQGETYVLSLPKSKKPAALSESVIKSNMEKILSANAIETKCGNLASIKKAAVIETTTQKLV